MGETSLQTLWESAPPRTTLFHSGLISRLPQNAQGFLRWAIEEGTPFPTITRLTMTGEIRLKSWAKFEATEWLHSSQGFEWSARTKVQGLPVSGADRLILGQGEMAWKILGLIPLMKASGPDITKSAAGRYAGELCWLPPALLGTQVRWEADLPGQARALISVAGAEVPVAFEIEPDGRLRGCSIARWGEVPGEGFKERTFRVVVEETGAFDGFRIPTNIRAGWAESGQEFGENGEFFRAQIERAEYR